MLVKVDAGVATADPEFACSEGKVAGVSRGSRMEDLAGASRSAIVPCPRRSSAFALQTYFLAEWQVTLHVATCNATLVSFPKRRC